MPVRYEVDVEREVVFAFYGGKITFDDGRALILSIRGDPRVRPHFGTLVDYTEATGLGDDGGYDRFAAYVEFYRSAGTGPRTARVALYVPERSAIFGVLRQFQMIAGNEERLRIFTGLAEARVWVGLPPE
jgi:hypothetical protein